MQVSVHRAKSLTYAVIDNLHNDDELTAINKELADLHRFCSRTQDVGTAVDSEGNPIKTGKGVFLDTLYQDRSCSAILQANRKFFYGPLIDALSERDAYFYHLARSTRDTTLLNYYGNGEYYLPHRDESVITCVSFFALGEFEGGDFKFDEHGGVIEFAPNRCVIFPGCALHSAAPIVASPNNYRVTVATFINYRQR